MLFAFFLLWSIEGQADINPPQAVDSFTILVNDKVKDGCWTNINAIKNRIKLKAANQNLNSRDASEDIVEPTILYFTAYGGSIPDGTCVVYIRIDIYQFLSYEGNQYHYYIFSRHVLLSGPKPRNQPVLEEVDGFLDDWFVDGLERGYIKRP